MRAAASSRTLLLVALLPLTFSAQEIARPLETLPASASATLAESLDAAAGHPVHVWRDTASSNHDGTINAYIEIPRGERRKWEFDMRANARAIDRVIPPDVGGYPVNYGFVPQTVSYDGDPFDALVLGPPLPGGSVVRGIVMGLMLMEDEKGIDSKVVLSVADADGRPRHQLFQRDRRDIADYFNRYKLHEPGKFSRVPGWGSIADGLMHVKITHAFFLGCRTAGAAPCRVSPF
jgi:inorganic pyrophosphatase